MFNLKRKRNISQLSLIYPITYNKLSKEEKYNICNGCGTKGLVFIPHKILWIDITEACNIHDYMYNIGSSLVDKDIADLVFLHNMLILINNNTKLEFLTGIRKLIASFYYRMVKTYGLPSFVDNKEYTFEKLFNNFDKTLTTVIYNNTNDMNELAKAVSRQLTKTQNKRVYNHYENS